MAIITAIVSAITATVTAISAALSATAITVGALSITVGALVKGLIIFGGVALSLTCSKKGAGAAGDYGATSPTYANGVIQTQTNQDLPIPLLYGTCKLAGNKIWQDEDGSKTVKRIVGFAEGEITEYTDI